MYLRVISQLRGKTLPNHTPGFQQVATIGNAQAQVRVLLNHEHADPKFTDALDSTEQVETHDG